MTLGIDTREKAGFPGVGRCAGWSPPTLPHARVFILRPPVRELLKRAETDSPLRPNARLRTPGVPGAYNQPNIYPHLKPLAQKR